MSALSVSQPPLWKEALAAIRANFIPGVVLWAIASAVVAAYYLVPATQGVFAFVADLKATGGYFFSLASTAFFAGLVPWLFLWMRPRTRGMATRLTLAFLVGMWAYRGVEIDLFYHLQTWVFGAGLDFRTVASKVACDMFVYNVVWAAQFQLLVYHWKNEGFRLSGFRNFDWSVFWRRKYPMALLTTWLVWLPVVTLTYLMPVNLQIPIFNLASCFWALVMTSLTAPRTGNPLSTRP